MKKFINRNSFISLNDEATDTTIVPAPVAHVAIDSSDLNKPHTFTIDKVVLVSGARLLLELSLESDKSVKRNALLTREDILMLDVMGKDKPRTGGSLIAEAGTNPTTGEVGGKWVKLVF